MRPGQKLPLDPTELDGPTKAAVLLLMLDQESAGGLLRELPSEMVEEVMRVLASIESVPAQLGQGVVDEFYEMSVSSGALKEGGLDYAKTLLKDSLDPKTAEKLFEDIRRGAQKAPFAFLQKAESENLLTFIQDEHPQTIALIVSHLPHHKASEILVGLPQEKQIEVVQRVASMEQTNPLVIQEVESGLESRLSNMLMHSVDRVGGTSTVAEILNLCDRQTERSIMEGMESDHPDLAEEVRRLMFVFEDILLVDDKGIQSVLKEVDNDELCLALKTASEQLQQKIFTNMSSRAAEVVKEDMEFMGPVRLSDVEAAQQRIVDIVRRLEDAGDIVITGRGGTQDVVV
ncbi:MAG: flagellar motor switch protein FliG [Planctomycetes bacterium TMED75]|nr:flagellar motor switch protein FliG [Planctomycetaceae bacterium]OUU90640.1 MAG: flagellar motor switch protein FliG [Planctomycetes bacterium TMED75]